MSLHPEVELVCDGTPTQYSCLGEGPSCAACELLERTEEAGRG